MTPARSLRQALLCAAIAASATTAFAKDITLLNVSYDPTRELYQDYNKAFAKHWKAKTGDTLVVKTSHGGSGKQARAVIDGLPADVVTLGLAQDIDEIAKRGLTASNWSKRLPFNSAPYYSTVVMVVRKGNPKNIRDWDDLIRPDVKVITSNPKTSGGGRWAYLAAWGYARQKYGSIDKAKAYMTKLYRNVPVLDSGARGSTTTFAERGQGDVLLAWENEAYLAVDDLGPGKFQIITPSVSVLAEPPVAVVDKNAAKHGTKKVADAYLKFLYTPEAQEIIAKHYYRPRNPAVAAKYRARLKQIPLFTVGKNFGGWAKTNANHFADGATFDQIFLAAKR